MSRIKLKDEPKIRKLAKDLGLGSSRNAEIAVREYCVEQVEAIRKDFGEIDSLRCLMDVVKSSIGLRFEEVNYDEDILNISNKYVHNEIMFADLRRTLDPKTDAVLFQLSKRHAWEPRYIAVVDCRGKKARAYFTKWHEITHVLTTPAQMSFKFRRTPALKKDPEEILVDRIAGDLAFYSPLFLPELLARMNGEKRITFELIEDLRRNICPEASRESVIRAAVSKSPFPQVMIIADYGLKKGEERQIASSQMALFPGENLPFEPKLRAVEVMGNQAAKDAKLWIFPNMEVPQRSAIFDAYFDLLSEQEIYTNEENLNWWSHSRGQLKNLEIRVDARKVGKRVFAIIGYSN